MKNTTISMPLIAVALSLAALSAGAQNMQAPDGHMPHAQGQGGPEGRPMWHGGEERGGPGMAHGEGWGAGGHGFGHGDFMRGLALTEAQKDRAFAIMHAQAPQLREQHKAIAKAHEELHALVMSGQFDEARAAGLTKALGQATAAAALLQARTHAQLIALLTPEQREQLARHRQPPGHPRP